MSDIMYEPAKTSVLMSKINQIPGPFLIRKNSTLGMPEFKRTEEWTQKQQIKFAAFLYTYGQKIYQVSKLEQWELFKFLARFVKTRNFTQSRSHYLKVLKKFKKISKFIQYLQYIYPDFWQNFQCYIQDLKSICFPLEHSSSIILPHQQKFAQDLPNTGTSYEDQQYKEPAQPINKPYSLPSSVLKIFYPNMLNQNKENMKENKIGQNMLMFWSLGNHNMFSTL